METNDQTTKPPPSPAATCSAFIHLPALSIRQPWAWTIIHAGKDIENRTWPTKFRGRFLIHAAKGCTKDEYRDAKSFILPRIGPEYRGKGLIFPGWAETERGGIIGMAEIVDCVSRSESPWFMGEFGFVIRNVTPLLFLPCRGSLGFFSVPNVRGLATATGGQPSIQVEVCLCPPTSTRER
jgi:hypothetical protein